MRPGWVKAKEIPFIAKHTHLFGVLLAVSAPLLSLQPGQQLLAHLHCGPQLAAHLVGLLSQRRAEHGPSGLGGLPLLQSGAQPVYLQVLLVVWLTPEPLQLLLLLLELRVQPLDFLGQGVGLQELNQKIIPVCRNEQQNKTQHVVQNQNQFHCEVFKSLSPLS